MSDSETPPRRDDERPDLFEPSGTVDPSRELRRNRAIQRFRWLVLLATVVAVVAVVWIYLAGRDDRAGGAGTGDDIESESMEPTGEMVTVGEGFERTVTEGNRQLFTVKGERYQVNREGVIFLEGVDVVIHREEGGQYRVQGQQARFVMEDKEGAIGGGVEVEGPDGMKLRTRRLRITNRGRQIQTNTPVAFEIGDGYQGTAEGLRAHVSARRYVLEGLVEIDSRAGAEPLHIQAKGLVLDRGRRLIRSQDWAVLRRRGERLSALRMFFYFGEDERSLRYVRADDRVTGLLRSGGSVDLSDAGARRIGFQADKMTLEMSEDGRNPKRLELLREGGQRPRVYTLGGPTVPRYQLTAPTVTAWFDAAGTASRLLAQGDGREGEAGQVELLMEVPEGAAVDESTLGAPPETDPETGEVVPRPTARGEGEDQEGGPARRRATGQEAEGTFGPDGEITIVEMRRDVRLVDAELEAEGERAVFQVGDERADLFGRPAVARGAQGEMEAPHILYTRESGLIRGSDGVRARIDEARESALGGSPLARGEGPVRVEAEQGYLRDEPRTFLFVGEVRAWRGDDLLVAEELRGDEAEDRLTATGGVRTLWNPDEDEGSAGADGPLEVTSDEMVYRQAERLLIYTGDVTAEQGGRVVKGREMTLTLAPEGSDGGGLERLVATGDVQVDVPTRAAAGNRKAESGKRLRGERAVYDPKTRTIDVTAAEGGKVTLRDGDGNVVEGPRMEYDIEADRVRMIGRADADAGADGGSP